jgi:hypothetical protein
MKLVSYNLTKLKAERFENIFKELKINTSIDLKEIKEAKNDILKTKDTILNIKFNYKINYNPKIAEIEFEGNLGIIVDSKKAKELLKNKKEDMDGESKINLFNLILRKTATKALQLEEELGLPPHFNIPTLKAQKKE